MKKINILSLLVIITCIMQACHSDQAQDKAKEAEFSGTKAILERPVDYKMAQACLDRYSRTISLPVTKRTNYVGFQKDSLMLWLKKIDSEGTYDTIRMAFGRYTPEILEKYGKPTKLKNRLTVFLFPYKKGLAARKDKIGKDNEVIQPFNMGEVNP